MPITYLAEKLLSVPTSTGKIEIFFPPNLRKAGMRPKWTPRSHSDSNCIHIYRYNEKKNPS